MKTALSSIVLLIAMLTQSCDSQVDSNRSIDSNSEFTQQNADKGLAFTSLNNKQKNKAKKKIIVTVNHDSSRMKFKINYVQSNFFKIIQANCFAKGASKKVFKIKVTPKKKYYNKNIESLKPKKQYTCYVFAKKAQYKSKKSVIKFLTSPLEKDCEGGLAHGDQTQRTAFEASSVPFGETCQEALETGTCNDGNIIWDASGPQSCVVEGPSSCGDIIHGEVAQRTAFESATVPFGESCQQVIETATCQNGTLSWSADGPKTCEIEPATCGSLAQGETAVRSVFTSSKVGFGETCESVEQTGVCNNGVMEWPNTGSFICSQQAPRDCGEVSHGDSVFTKFYKTASAGYPGICEFDFEEKVCEDGILKVKKASEYTEQSCQAYDKRPAAPTKASIDPYQPNGYDQFGFWRFGHTTDRLGFMRKNCDYSVKHGEIVGRKVYTTGLSTTIGKSCNSINQTTRCNDGRFEPYSPGGQYYSTCSDYCGTNSSLKTHFVELDSDGTKEYLLVCRSDTRLEISTKHNSSTNSTVVFNEKIEGSDWKNWEVELVKNEETGLKDLYLTSGMLFNRFPNKGDMTFQIRPEVMLSDGATVNQVPDCLSIKSLASDCYRFDNIDLNKDGALDSVISIISGFSQTIYSFTKAGETTSYKVNVWRDNTVYWRAETPQIKDVDKDGILDVYFLDNGFISYVKGRSTGGFFEGIKNLLKMDYDAFWETLLKFETSNTRDLALIENSFAEYSWMAGKAGFSPTESFLDLENTNKEEGLTEAIKDMYINSIIAFEVGDLALVAGFTKSIAILNPDMAAAMNLQFGLSGKNYYDANFDIVTKLPSVQPCSRVCQQSGQMGRSLFPAPNPYSLVIEIAVTPDDIGPEPTPEDYWREEADHWRAQEEFINEKIANEAADIPDPEIPSWEQQREEAQKKAEEAESKRDEAKALEEAAKKAAEEEEKKKQEEEEKRKAEEEEKKKQEEETKDRCEENRDAEGCGENTYPACEFIYECEVLPEDSNRESDEERKQREILLWGCEANVGGTAICIQNDYQTELGGGVVDQEDDTCNNPYILWLEPCYQESSPGGGHYIDYSNTGAGVIDPPPPM